MDPISLFISDFKHSLDPVKPESSEENKCSIAFFNDFIEYTPKILSDLNNNIQKEKIDVFYLRLNDLKYLCVYNEYLNEYWFAMRGLSGALARLLADCTVGNAGKVQQYYTRKYDRRVLLRDENWFESRRWHFLDLLGAVNSEEELKNFIARYLSILNHYLDNYQFHLNCFIQDIKKSLSL